MLFSQRSPLTGKINSIDLPLTEEEFEAAFENWQDNVKIQDAFPTLTPAQREFIMTGYTEEDWAKMFG